MSENIAPSPFVLGSLGLDFTNITGVLFLSGWNYTVEQTVIEEFVNRIEIYGFHVDQSGEADNKYRDIKVAWEYRGGTWDYMKDESGLVREKATKDGRHIDPKSADRIVDHVGRGINEWNMTPLDDTAPEPKRKRGQKAIEPKNRALPAGKSAASAETDIDDIVEEAVEG